MNDAVGEPNPDFIDSQDMIRGGRDSSEEDFSSSDEEASDHDNVDLSLEEMLWPPELLHGPAHLKKKKSANGASAKGGDVTNAGESGEEEPRGPCPRSATTSAAPKATALGAAAEAADVGGGDGRSTARETIVGPGTGSLHSAGGMHSGLGGSSAPFPSPPRGSTEADHSPPRGSSAPFASPPRGSSEADHSPPRGYGKADHQAPLGSNEVVGGCSSGPRGSGLRHVTAPDTPEGLTIPGRGADVATATDVPVSGPIPCLQQRRQNAGPLRGRQRRNGASARRQVRNSDADNGENFVEMDLPEDEGNVEVQIKHQYREET